jgi:hypothetical protein
MTVLNEGGNVFKGEDGTPVTQRINRDDVDPTLDWLEKVTGIPHREFKLGTTGIKSSSGDMDIAVDQNSVDKTELAKRLVTWVKQNHPEDDPKKWVAKSGISLHFKTPIRGDVKNGFVQTDLMFGEPDWMKFTMKGSGDESEFKGVHRAVMMASLAKAQGMKWSSQAGLTDRASGELISRTPDEIAKKLLGTSATANDLDSVETMVAKIKNRPDYEQLVADAKENFEKQGLKLPEAQNHPVGTMEWFSEMMRRVS